MRTVRTTMRPHERVQVSESEYTDLHRQGLLAPEPAAPPPAPAVNTSPEHAPAPEPAAAPARRKSTDKKTAPESGADTKEG